MVTQAPALPPPGEGALAPGPGGEPPLLGGLPPDVGGDPLPLGGVPEDVGGNPLLLGGVPEDVGGAVPGVGGVPADSGGVEAVPGGPVGGAPPRPETHTWTLGNLPGILTYTASDDVKPKRTSSKHYTGKVLRVDGQHCPTLLDFALSPDAKKATEFLQEEQVAWGSQ
jgi:hypothetical protein